MHKIWAMADTKAINRHLRGLREEREWTQWDAARKCGWDQAKISKLETGHRMPSIDDLVVIAKAFSVKLNKLVKIRTEAS